MPARDANDSVKSFIHTAMSNVRCYVSEQNSNVYGLSVANKNPASGAYETPAADSRINNLEWIIQKRSGSNPSNNILSRSSRLNGGWSSRRTKKQHIKGQ